MNVKEAKKRLEELGQNLTADDFNYDQRIIVVHQDGSMMNFVHAFHKEEDSWYFVFTEHNGYHMYYKEDLSLFQPYTRFD